MSRSETLRLAATMEEKCLPHVLVTLAGVHGSAPQDLGAKMLVDSGGLVSGTVGGGKLEAAALGRAAETLAAGRDTVFLEEWDLRRDIGMTCGGRVTVVFEVRAAVPWTIAIFGAGHVVQSLVPMLLPLAAIIEVRDTREDWIARLPKVPNVRAGVCGNLAAAVDDVPSGAFVLAITQGHQTDRPVLAAAFRRGDLPFIGAIGSKSKAAVLRRELREDGIGEDSLAALQCPLGLDLGTNHPQEIAISISAQLLLERDRHAACK